MSNLIRGCRAMTTAPRSPPQAHPSAATTPAQMDHLLVGPGVSQAPASSASSVALPISGRRGHRRPHTPDTPSTSTTDASGSQQAKKNTRGPCRQLKTAKITRVTNNCISIGYDERHRAAPTAEQHNGLAHDIGHVVRTSCPMKWKSWKVMPDEMRTHVRSQLLVAFAEGCPKEFEGREDNWAWLCGHFQEPDYVKAKANKGNRNKKTLLHHSGSKLFSYQMEARRRGVQNSRRSMS